jgi:hypothetical protein
MKWILGKPSFGVIWVINLIVVSGFADQLDSWQWRNPLPQARALSSITYGNGTFVAVGGSGTILTSTDGIDWIRQSTADPTSLFGVAFGNGNFVAVGFGGTILLSPDGRDWKA